ncbi:MAG TPA: hypothetical protein VF319_18210, partial [Caldimonas sp.]
HYHLLPSVRGDLLARLGRMDEACAEFERAADLTHNVRERELLLGQARASRKGDSPRPDGAEKGPRRSTDGPEQR